VVVLATGDSAAMEGVVALGTGDSAAMEGVVVLATGDSAAMEGVVALATGDSVALALDSASPNLSATPPRHPPPCSQDFAFYRGIEGTRGTWSPEEPSSPLSPHQPPSPPLHLLASPSPPSSHFWSPNSPVFRRAPALAPSCGVALRPLTQAPPGKRPRLEDEGSQEELEEEEQQQKEQEELEERSEEDLALPLTFHSRADLLWKLRRADLLPGGEKASSQRPGAPRPTAHGDEGEVGRENAGVEERSTVEVKVEPEDEDAAGAPRPCPGREPQAGRPALLHRAPRLGLSRLERRLPSIHEVTILQEVKEEAADIKQEFRGGMEE